MRASAAEVGATATEMHGATATAEVAATATAEVTAPAATAPEMAAATTTTNHHRRRRCPRRLSRQQPSPNTEKGLLRPRSSRFST